MLCDKLKPAIWSKWGLLSESVALLHNNACPLSAAHIVDSLKKLNFDVLEHPPYSPDLAPSDCHLFGTLKQALRGCRFTTDQQLKETVHAWLVSQPITFYCDAIKKTVWRWTKCINKQADYVEKWCPCQTSTFVVINVKYTLWMITYPHSCILL
jgi:hypothetical protein